MATKGAPTGAPVQLTSFVGRSVELTSLLDLLSSNRLLTLVGPGGVGKTRLAIEAARRLSEDRAVWFVDLARGGAGASATVAESLGLSPVGVPTPEAVATFLSQQSAVLVVMDNCEHVIDEVSALTRSVLATTPDVRFLATSREPLRVAGEQLFIVPPLTSGDGVQLLVDRARRVSPRLSPDSNDLVELCSRLDGLPLALELAAARLSALTANEIIAALGHSVGLLSEGVRGGPARHASLDACVGWSYELLADGERRLLRQLSVLGCPFPLDAARAIADTTTDEALTGVAALVDKSLLTVVSGRGHSHYVLLDVVRRFARDRLAEAGEEPSARHRHLEWLVASALATQREFEGDRLVDNVRDWQERTHDIGAAIEWAAATNRADEALQLVGALWRFWWAGAKGAGPEIIRAALAIPGGSAASRARALVAATLAASAQLDFGAAVRHGQEAVQVADESADAEARALARCWLGWMLVIADPSAAEHSLAESLATAPADCVDIVADVRNARAYLEVTQGRLRTAAEEVEAVLELTRVSGNRVTQAHAMTSRAFLGLLSGRFAEARSAIDAALPVVRSTNDAAYTAMLLLLEVCVSVHTGRVSEANLAAGNLRVLVTSMQPPVLAGAADFADALIAAGVGDHMRALGLWAAVTATSGETAAPLQVLAATELAVLRIELGQPELAGAALEAAVPLAGDAHSWMAERLGLAQAQVSMATGKHQRAVTLAYDALASAEALDDRVGLVETLVVLAGLAAQQSRQHSRATRVAAAASAEADRLGYVLTTFGRELVRSIREGNGSSTAWTTGRELTLGDAIAEIRSGRGARGRPATGWESLTPAERRVVHLIGRGRTNPQIAASLFVSVETVKGHVSSSLRKLGVTSRSELAAYAARQSTS